MTKEIIKQNDPVSSERLRVRRYAASVFSVAATVLALAIAITGSVFADINTVGSDVTSQNESGASHSAYLTEEKTQVLDGFEKAIGELDARISQIDTEIDENKNIGTPEKNIYVKSLYDEKTNLLLKKTESCIEYSNACIAFAQETRVLLSEPISEYEKYHAAYKDRLSAVYENGFPDVSEIFGTSENLMDFVMGKVMLDEVRDYDEELYGKVLKLYAVLEDGLNAVNFYLATSESYLSLGSAAREALVKCALDGKAYLKSVCTDRDTYNYFLQYSAEQDQRFSALLKDAQTVSGNDTPKFLFPLDAEYFYTDYIGRGHESRYEYSPALGSYVSLFHSGREFLTHGRYAPVKAAADGKVVFADYCPIRGYTVALLHSGGIFTVYSSCGSLNVSLGDEVKALDTVAFSGMSGNSDEFAVNFEIFEKGAFVDPDKYLALPDVSVSEKQK